MIELPYKRKEDFEEEKYVEEGEIERLIDYFVRNTEIEKKFIEANIYIDIRNQLDEPVFRDNLIKAISKKKNNDKKKIVIVVGISSTIIIILIIRLIMLCNRII